jgi:hypothetical protein
MSTAVGCLSGFGRRFSTNNMNNNNNNPKRLVHNTPVAAISVHGRLILLQRNGIIIIIIIIKRKKKMETHVYTFFISEIYVHTPRDSIITVDLYRYTHNARAKNSALSAAACIR